MQFFKRFDLFGSTIGLNMRKNSVYSTNLSGFLSLVVAIQIAVYFWINFIDFINQEKLTVSSEREYNTNPPAITTGQHSMMFAIKIHQTNSDFMQTPYFNIDLHMGAFENTDNKLIMNYHRVELEPCSEAHFKSFFEAKNINQDQQNIKSTLVNRFLCPKLNQVFMLRGLYTSPNFDFVRIQLRECVQSELESQNPNWKATCASKDLVSSYLNSYGNFRVGIYHNNFIVSTDKQGQYNKQYLNEDLQFLFIPHQMFKSVDIFFRDYNIETTTYSLFAQSVQKESFIVQEYKDFTENTVFGRKDDIYAQLFLRRSPFTQTYYRNHQSFAQFLSGLGGFVNILITVAGLLMRRYNYFQFSIDLANQLYNFKLIDPQSNSKENVEQSNLRSSKLSILKKQNILKQSTPRLTQTLAQNNQNVSIPESPSKISRRSSRLTEDHFKMIESPKFSQKRLTQNQNTQSINLVPTKNPQNDQQFTLFPTSQYKLKKSNQDLISQVRQKLWKVVKLINSRGFTYQDYKRNKQISIPTFSKMRQQLQNYKQLGYLNQIDFLIDNFKKLIKQQQIKINLGLTYCFGFCKFYKKQNTVLNKAWSNISQDLDIYTILSKIQEIEKIKRILFNQEQLTLFSFSLKPVITSLPTNYKNIEQIGTSTSQPLSQQSVIQNNELFLQKNTNFTEYNTYQKLYTSYDKLMSREQKNGLNIVNNRLIKELGGEIKEIFEIAREINKESEIINKQKSNDSFEKIIKKSPASKFSTFKQYQQPSQQNLVQQSSRSVNLFSQFNCLTQQQKVGDEACDHSNINQRSKLNDESHQKSTYQPSMNISFFDLQNKSELIVVDTIPDIPLESASQNKNFENEYLQKETTLKRIE